MRLSISSDTIKLEIKPFVLQVDPLQFQEEIKYLYSHMKSGTILPHVEGVYFKSNVEPFTFHADYEFKQKSSANGSGCRYGTGRISIASCEILYKKFRIAINLISNKKSVEIKPFYTFFIS